MSIFYDILCYRVMYRNRVNDKWIVQDFAIEEIAYDHYIKIRNEYKYAKMLRIEKVR